MSEADLFGTPEPATVERQMLTVSELTRAVRMTLEDSIGTVWVEGEVSNYRKQPSGHQYFTLKDAQSQVSCVWFARGGFRTKQTALSDGMQVQIRGALTVYEARGQYQLNVALVQAGGAGLLQAKFEALKRKLLEEGLFDAERKRPLPRFPRTIGLVTSPTGAAIRDILNILGRRAPWVRVIIHPVRVQGDGAAEEISAGIDALNELTLPDGSKLDVVLVGRGGGSVEDLWEFNEEIVARAIVRSAIPIVSAVGHEVDFTIADFVADLRAPTPSAAAELIVPDSVELARLLANRRNQLLRAAAGPLLQERNRLAFLARNTSLQSPVRRVRELTQRLDTIRDTLQQLLEDGCADARRKLAELANRIERRRPDQLMALRRIELAGLTSRLKQLIKSRCQEQKQRFARLETLVRALSPDATLARGYSLTTTEEGKILRSKEEAQQQKKIVTKFRDGSITTSVGD